MEERDASVEQRRKTRKIKMITAECGRHRCEWKSNRVHYAVWNVKATAGRPGKSTEKKREREKERDRTTEVERKREKEKKDT